MKLWAYINAKLDFELPPLLFPPSPVNSQAISVISERACASPELFIPQSASLTLPAFFPLYKLYTPCTVT